jgi:sugar lactone lactonase YvrE
VIALDATGEGLASAEVTATKTFPAEPTGLSATAVSATQINLNWVGVIGASSYKIYRSTAPGVTIVAGNLVSSAANPAPNAGSYWDSGLVAGTTYYYKVVAISGATVSTSSAEATAATPAATTPPVVGSQMGGGRIGSALTLSASVTTVAGYSTTGTSVNGIGKAASFSSPTGMATDGVNLYVTDPGSHTIRKIVIATGDTTTLAGSSGTAGSADGTGTAASFNNPIGITTDGVNLYVADSINNKIRKIEISTGVVSTFAGTGTAGAVDDVGILASFNQPYGITTDGSNLFVVDRLNHKIRQIVISTGAVSTVAGAGSIGATDGIGAAAKFNYPYGITTDGVNLYVADHFNNSIRKVEIATKTVSTLAGKGSLYPGAIDGTGTAAWFYYPYGVTTDGINVYVADQGNSEIRKIVISTGVVSTLAGTNVSGTGVMGYVDGVGSAARFNNPVGITSDGVSLYVSDMYNYNIRRIQ